MTRPGEHLIVIGREGDATLCSFELKGKKAGQVCGQRLCDKCKVVVDGKTLCPAHARLVATK